MTDDQQLVLREGLKQVAVTLKELERPFALSGGYAGWVHGAPEPDHDVDFLVLPQDAPEAAAALLDQGLDVRQPPEDWLFKVAFDGAVIDVIHRATGSAVRDILARAEQLSVLSVIMPVVAPTDLCIERLLALDEHYCNYAALLPCARAVRERVDWSRVRRAVAGHPFAEAFVYLLERLDIVPADQSG